MQDSANALQAGLDALKQGQYPEAIAWLESARETMSDYTAPDYLRIMMGLASAYQYSGELDHATSLYNWLTQVPNPEIQTWAEQGLQSLVNQANPPLTATVNQPDVAAAEVEHEPDPAATQPVTAQPEEETVQPAIVPPVLATTAASKISPETPQPEPTPDRRPAQPATKAPPAAEPPETVEPGIRLRTIDELKAFYQKVLLPELKEIEKARQFFSLSLGIVTVGLLVFLVTILTKLKLKFLFDISPIFYFAANFLLIFGALWAWVAFFTSAADTYRRGFKGKIIQKLIAFADRDQLLHYSIQRPPQQTLQSFIQSQIFINLGDANQIRENEPISGRIGETEIHFSEILVQQERDLGLIQEGLDILDWLDNGTLKISFFQFAFTVLRSIYYIFSRLIKGQGINYSDFEAQILRGEKNRTTIFKGLFLRADFNKSLKTVTIVLPKGKQHKQIGELVKLEDPEFNRFFTVYGDDQIEARYALSTSLMARLVEFRKKANRPVYLSFIDRSIYVAIAYEQDLFEAKLFQNMVNGTPIKEYFQYLQLMLGIVDDLNLNRRIWTRS